MKRIIEIPDKLYSDIMTIGINIGKIDYLLTAIKESEEIKFSEDTISREAVLEIIRDRHGLLARADVLSATINEIKSLPPVNPQPKTGYWIKKDGYSDCSECGSHIVTEWDYCPKCGARMEGEDKE